MLVNLNNFIAICEAPLCDQMVKEEDCEKALAFHVGIFYCALYIIALGAARTKPNGVDKFNESKPNEKPHKLSFFNW